MKFCAKCGKRVDSTTCQYCGYHLDKTFISFKIRQSNKKLFYIVLAGIGIVFVLYSVVSATLDPYGVFYDKGDFVLYYYSANDPRYKQIEDLFYNSGYFDRHVSSLNDQYKLPYNVNVSLQECNVANAFYDEATKDLVICYELIDIFIEILYPHSGTDEELISQLEDVIYWVFLHELGHVFIDVYNLPLLGGSEEAADQLATIVILKQGPTGVTALESVTITLIETSSAETPINTLEYWDIHSFNLQRYYDILCFIYGKDPSQFTYLVGEGLPPDRATTCESEYNKISSSWDEVLAPYRK